MRHGNEQREVCEAALGYVRSDQTVKAYARGDLFDKTPRADDGLEQVLHNAGEGRGRRHPATRCAVRAPPDLVAAGWVYGEANWQEIKKSLAERDVDLDTVTVDERLVPEPWWQPDDSTVQRPLREALQVRAWHYGALAFFPKPAAVWPKLQTPKQQAQALGESLAAFENALAMLHPTLALADNQRTHELRDARIKTTLALRAELSREIDELRSDIARLTAMGSRSAENARTVHNDCWRDFARLWRTVTPSAGKFRRKHLRSFLVACTKPLLPEMTSQEFEQKLDSFIKNFFEPT